MIGHRFYPSNTNLKKTIASKGESFPSLTGAWCFVDSLQRNDERLSVHWGLRKQPQKKVLLRTTKDLV